MALFYQMIKGLTNNTGTDGDQNKLLYFYIAWPININKEGNAHPLFYTSYNNLHTLTNLNDSQQATNRGEIFVGGLDNTLTGSISLNRESKITIDENTYITRPKDSNADYGLLKGIWNFGNPSEATNTNISDGALITKSFIAINTFKVQYKESNKDPEDVMLLKGNNIQIKNNLEVTGHVDATYFNATSDCRAKTDISLFTSPVLDVIKSVQIKNFKFKSEPNQPTFGIIAQELQEKAPELNLVNNLDADGKTSFMSIKEDRLIYLLWKAVQEQQAQIENLQQEIAKLKEE